MEKTPIRPVPAVLRLALFPLLLILLHQPLWAEGWIRISQIGYLPSSSKVAVLMYEEEDARLEEFRVVDVYTGNVAYSSRPGDIKATGILGEGIRSTFRLDFSALGADGSYRIEAGGVRSEVFPISGKVFDGRADFLLRYMRQQRCGYNPFIRDSCHTHDGIIEYHPAKSGTRLDVRGGWHDASDCLQYTATSANAIYQMMLAYEANPGAFGDEHLANGLGGRNGIPDIVDEIIWGLDWLDRMNPAEGEYYNQIADDRDHVGMRLPSKDQADYGYGKGLGRPVYFCTGKPQQRGKYLNETTGIASTAGKFASCFALGEKIIAPFDPALAGRIGAKAMGAYLAGKSSPGACQTASVVSPYIYAEDNWTDDMELAAMELYRRNPQERSLRDDAVRYGRMEPVTPWMGADSARHYQWYPFMNMGHVRLAQGGTRESAEFIRNLRSGILRTYEKAQGTPFMYGIPPIWCSNNLVTAMLTQCILYRQLTGDETFLEMEGSLRDWLLGCNPWGVCMVVGLVPGGTFPTQPHSFIISHHLGTTEGGLVDGPVYRSIFSSLLGISTEGGINYPRFQPHTMVYHDSTHDYSTNEPTMDGTASLIFPFSLYEAEGHGGTVHHGGNIRFQGGITRTDPSRRRISLVFTAAGRDDGAKSILGTLRREGIKGSFFFTGEFFEKFPDTVRDILAEGHYVGSHSYGHLLYCPWEKRDSLLVSREEFTEDIVRSYRLMAPFGITPGNAPLFMPPYEYYNSAISEWARSLGLQVVNYTSGTYTNGDYTTPDMDNYYSSEFILGKVMQHERTKPDGLSGHIMLIHLGTDPSRTDKFYDKLPSLIRTLRRRGYSFVGLEEAVGE